jgi:uncharacterized protein
MNDEQPPRKGFATVAALLMAVAVAGCASTAAPTHYHSLIAPQAPSGVAVKAVAAPNVRVHLQPVTLPVQVDVPQIVVRLPDDSMAVLERERWIAPPGDEIHAVVTLRIEQALAQAGPVSWPAADRSWRVRIEVLRFDSMLGRAASVQVQWSLHAVSGGTVLRCQANYEQPVGPGVSALVAGHRAVFERLGDAIGQAVTAAAAGGTPSCG